jgi:hypothetical protein
VSDRHLFLALTNPAEGREDDFDRWYDRHVQEVLERYDGFVSGRRYWASEQQVGGGPLPWRHLAAYEVRTDDLVELHRSNGVVFGSGGLTGDDGALAPGSAAWTFTALEGAERLPHERHLYLALTDPAEGRDEDFNEWYDRHHLPEILRHTPGFTAGRRFERASAQREGQLPGWQYLALYQVDAEDIGASLDAIVPLIKDRTFTSPRGALDPGHASWSYTGTGERFEA